MGIALTAVIGLALSAMSIAIWQACNGLARHFDRMAIMQAMEAPHDD